MPFSENTLAKLIEKHPHSESLIKALAPLLQARIRLAEELPPPEAGLSAAEDRLPSAAGDTEESCISVQKVNHDNSIYASYREPLTMLSVYFDKPFTEAAPDILAEALAKGFPNITPHARAIAKVVKEKPEATHKLCHCYLSGQELDISPEFSAVNKDVVHLFIANYCSAAARRIAQHAPVFEKYSGTNCPVCGHLPHGASMKKKEGSRLLQCSLCGYEWHFSRTVCPACGQNALSEQPVFFIEDSPEERAEACTTCNQYILSVDKRNMADDAPLELILLGMGHLDVMMQERGFFPVGEAAHQ